MVIEALRNKRMTWTELKELTYEEDGVTKKIPDKTLDRILKEYLSFWGLIKKVDFMGKEIPASQPADTSIKKRKGLWSWYETTRTYNSRELELALERSRKLSIGLEAILAEIPNLWTSSERAMEWVRKIEHEGRKFKPFAEQHLKTGYPEIYEKVMLFRRLGKEIKTVIEETYKELPERTKQIIQFVVYSAEPLGFEPPPISDEVQNINVKRLDVYEELTHDIRLVIMKINMGEPLDGICQLCPRVSIVESEKTGRVTESDYLNQQG